MEYKTDILFEDMRISQANLNKSQNIKKIEFISKITRINLSQKYSKAINFILFEIIFLFLPNKITAKNLIEITVNNIGCNQIFGDEYTGSLPSKIIYNI